MTGIDCHIVESNKTVNDVIAKTAEENNIKCIRANMACTEYFDPYLDDVQNVIDRLPKEENLLGSEMEAFALFFVAKQLGKKASALITVADSNYKKVSITAEERQENLKEMIKLALDSSLKL